VTEEDSKLAGPNKWRRLKTEMELLMEDIRMGVRDWPKTLVYLKYNWDMKEDILEKARKEAEKIVNNRIEETAKNIVDEAKYEEKMS